MILFLLVSPNTRYPDTLLLSEEAGQVKDHCHIHSRGCMIQTLAEAEQHRCTVTFEPHLPLTPLGHLSLMYEKYYLWPDRVFSDVY